MSHLVPIYTGQNLKMGKSALHGRARQLESLSSGNNRHLMEEFNARIRRQKGHYFSSG
jgi:hypothetical protein